jgi:hypothetical protein
MTRSEPGGTLNQIKTLLCLLVLLGIGARAQSLPSSNFLDASRSIDWSTAGFTIPSYSANCATQPTMGNGAGNAAANTASIVAALNSCDASHNVVNIPSSLGATGGVWYINKLAFPHGSVVLRGAGPQSTKLTLESTGGCVGGIGNQGICMVDSGGIYNGNAAALPPSGTQQCTWSGTNGTAGTYTKGATTLNFTACGGTPPNGKIIILDQANDTTDTNGVYICQQNNSTNCNNDGTGNNDGRVIGGVSYSQQQVTLITGVTSLGGGAYTVTVSPGVYFSNIRTAQSPGAWWPGYVKNMGLENMSLDGSLLDGGTVGMGQCYQCWVKNVVSTFAHRNHIGIYMSMNDVVRDSYFYQAQNHTSNSYGVELEESSGVLVENNIFQQTVAPLMFGQGSGSVVGYNFGIYNYYTGNGDDPPDVMEAASSSHNSGNEMNLWEGNTMQSIWSDNVWGSSSQTTYFRNSLTGWQAIFRANGTCYPNLCEETPIIIRAFNRGYNVVGNVLGQPSFNTGYEMYATSTSGGVNGSEDSSIYSLGWATGGFGGANNGACSATLCDSLSRSSLMRWGNYDTINNAVQWNSTEASPASIPWVCQSGTATGCPSGTFTSTYFNSLAHTLPNSLYYPGTPSWWPTGSIPFPPIGPDVTGGNDGICSAGVYAKSQAYSASQCPSGSVTPAWGGHVNAIPAQVCYLNTMSGPPDGSGSELTFDAGNCYPTGSGSDTVSPPNLTYTITFVHRNQGPSTVTLTNTGGSAITVSSIGVTGDYSQTNNCPGSLPVSSNCTVNVTFAPTGAGTRTGILTIADSVTTHTVTLSGTAAFQQYSFGRPGSDTQIIRKLVEQPTTGYSAYLGTDYVPLPGCPSSGACTAPIIPAAGSGCSPASSNYTSKGCFFGTGFVISSGLAPQFAGHPIVRLTDATDLNFASMNTGSDSKPFSNVNSTVFAVANTSGSIFLKGFNPAGVPSVAPFSKNPQFTGLIIFDPVQPNVLYDQAHVTCTGTLPAILTCSDSTAAEIDKVTLGSVTSGGTQCTAPLTAGLTPCVLSATKLFNFVTDSTKCLDSSYTSPTWNSDIRISSDGTSFTMGFSNTGGQQTGAVVANYTVGQGCRVWHTNSRIVTGDWGPTSCSDGSATCYDGTALQTNPADVFNDWLDSTNYANGKQIAPYLNNANHCVFQAVQTGTGKSASCSPNTFLGCQATYPNWDAMDGGSCTSSATLVDGTVTWALNSSVNSGVNGGVCGAGCTPISETDTFTMHETNQLPIANLADAAVTAPGLCLQELGHCSNTNYEDAVWTINSLNATSCFEERSAAKPDWQPNMPLVSSLPGGTFNFIYPRNGVGRSGNPGNLYYKVTTAGTTSGTEPNWSAAQVVGNAVVDGTVHYQAQSVNTNDGTCLGHGARGQAHDFKLTSFQTQQFTNYGATFPQTTTVLAADIHGSYNNANSTDTNPFFYIPQMVDGPPTTGQWLNPSFNPNWAELDGYQPSYATTLSTAITNIAIASNVVTVTASNSFATGAPVYLAGLTTATFLNNTTLQVQSPCASAPCATFTARFVHADYASHADTGTVGEIIANGATGMRFGHNFNSGSNGGFSIQNGIGMVSQDGKWYEFLSDWEGTLGGEQGSATCGLDSADLSNFLDYQTTHSYTKGTTFWPRSNNALPFYYTVTTAGTSGSCYPGAAGCAQTFPQTAGATVTTGTAVLTAILPPCRGDVFLMKLR